jgi:prepilin-type N-terminal cleavage/methylation domain-containing protein
MKNGDSGQFRGVARRQDLHRGHGNGLNIPAVHKRLASRGVTLLELLIVMTLIALLIGISYPSVSKGIESMRLRSTSDRIASLLNTAIDRAQRRQQVVEVWIAPKDNMLIARSPDMGFVRRLEVPPTFRITGIVPAAEVEPGDPRRFLMYPGGTVPGIGVEITAPSGQKHFVQIDVLSGLPRVEEAVQ